MNETVNVAIRVRPLVEHELNQGCKSIIDVIKENHQIIIRGTDKAFTFNYALGPESPQEELYEKCVAPLLNRLFNGFNVTVFAYGQTGSGKTHSMGTSCNGEADDDGVIPRVVKEIFSRIDDEFSIDYTITVSFTELYRDSLYDLLSNKTRSESLLEIREDLNKGIHIPNLTEIPVASAKQVLEHLMKGSLGRATASTNMNSHSSRSHSIFTLNLAMQNKTNKNENKTAKLHLVDLAGSERMKKTGAQGKTLKEGIDINKGLLALGNVISALGDEKNQNTFIPYRDHSLTRLLKDSLGGNSITLMIACISPADYNVEETISTLRYADRAKKIKNKPIVNQDPKIAEINELKRQVKQLQLQIVGQGGPIISICEIDSLKTDNANLTIKIKQLKADLSVTLLNKTALHEKVLILQSANENLNKKLAEIKVQYKDTFDKINENLLKGDMEKIKEYMIKFGEIQGDLDLLRDQQLKTEQEIKLHENTFTNIIQTSHNSTTPKELQEKEDFHNDQQFALGSQLDQVNKELAHKEELVKQLAANTRNIVDQESMWENERKIDALEKEKNSLLQQLHSVKSHGNANKVSEQRRKRVQELEEQLKDLKRKVLEQTKLLKMKSTDELRVKQLNKDIVEMKNIKVKLLKQIREGNERFRLWKQLAERELAKVKLQDQKKKTEIAKMKLTHEKQKNVLKRKFEEAAAMNKRLQNTLAKRKQVQETRFGGKTERIVGWLKEEMEMHVNIAEAETTVAILIEDRATLQHQLDELRNMGKLADASELKNIEEDIELRSVQIQDLQQKLLDSDEENKSSKRFDAIQTMGEAKYALRALFNQAADYRQDELKTRNKLKNLQDSNNELEEKIKTIREENLIIENHFKEQLAAEQASSQEKIAILLNQLRDVELKGLESNLAKTFEIQAAHIEKQDEVIKDLNLKVEELISELKEINKISLTGKTPKIVTAEAPAKKLKMKKEIKIELVEDQDEQEILSGDDDVENDPDWRKTPLGKRVTSLATRAIRKPLYIPDINDGEASNKLVHRGSKRSSDGGCACTTNCASQRCKCRKLKKCCEKSCRCSSGCSNQLNQTDSSNATGILVTSQEYNTADSL